MAATLAVLSFRRVEDFAQAKLVAKAGLPGGFGPPANDVFANTVHGLVPADQVEHPVREEVDVGVAVGGQQPDAAMLADEAVPNGEAFLLGGDVAQGVCGGRVDELGDVGAKGAFGWGYDGGFKGGGDDKVGFFSFDSTLAFGLEPDAETASSSALLAADAHLRSKVI